MSKIGKMPVAIKEEVTVEADGNVVKVNGPKGALSFTLPDGISLQIGEGKVLVSQTNREDSLSAFTGLVRAQIANMIKGTSIGFEKKLELSGVGYRAQVNGRDLVLSVGFSHPVKVSALEGITFAVFENTIVVSGIDKALVGDIAAKIRSIRPPEPYKGKGIKYTGERIRRKAGKAAKAVGVK